MSIFHILVFIFFISLFCVNPVKAEATSYKQCSRDTKIGKYYIWTDTETNVIRISKSKTGTGNVLVYATSGRNISDCISNGTMIYYAEVEYTGPYNEEYIGYIYSIKTSGNSKSYIGKVKSVDSIAAYYSGNIYLNCGQAGSESGSVCRLNIKTGKAKCVVDGAVVRQQYKQYLLAIPNSGDADSYGKLYSYNCKTGKKVCVIKECSFGNIANGKIYYWIGKNPYSNDCSYDVYSCSLSGKNKKKILKDLKCSYITSANAKYVYYMKYDDSKSEFIYYRYNLKTKKSTKIKEPVYYIG